MTKGAGNNVPSVGPKTEVTIGFRVDPLAPTARLGIEAAHLDPDEYVTLGTHPVDVRWGAGPNGMMVQLVCMLPADLFTKSPSPLALNVDPGREISRFITEDVLGRGGSQVPIEVAIVVRKSALRPPDVALPGGAGEKPTSEDVTANEDATTNEDAATPFDLSSLLGRG